MKRIFVFILAAVLLVGAVPVKEVKAAEYINDLDAYYSWREVCEKLGFSDVYSYNDNYTRILDSAPYFIVCRRLSSNRIYVLSFENLPGYIEIGKRIVFYSEYLDSPIAVYFTSSLILSGSSPSSLTTNSYYLGYEVDLLYANFPFTYDLDTNYNSSISLFDHEHTWIFNSSAATCTTSGKTWEECECGAIQNEVEIPALGHTWEQKEEPGSCIEDSRTWEECSVCRSVQNEVVIPASGHVWIYKEEPATCTTSGRSWEECGCGEIRNEMELQVAPHSLIVDSIPATCTNTGISWNKCSECGIIISETVLSALGHGILIYKVIKEPTVDEEGLYNKVCSVCNEIVETGSISTIRPTATPRPSATPRVTATPRPTSTPRPTATPRPGVTITVRPTATPKPTMTPRPTFTPRPTVSLTPPDYEQDSADLLSVTTVIMSLFTVFPLNVILIGSIIILGIGIFIALKKGVKK